MKNPPSAIAGVCIGLFAACSGGTESTEPVARVREAASLSTRAFALPDSLERGKPLTLRIESVAANGCYEVGETPVEITARVAVVRPYWYHYRNAFCTQALQTFEHVVTLQLPEEGEVTIRVVGAQASVERRIRIYRRSS